jgi:hypothetical protein
VCTATYTVAAADLTGERLSNTATVTATARGGDPVVSDPSTVRVDSVAPIIAAVSGAGLASTGSTVGWGVLWAALAVMAAGALLLLVRRGAQRR